MWDIGPVELMFMYYELMDPCVYDMIEHAEPLGSLGLNGAGDDPAVYVQTGVYDEGMRDTGPVELLFMYYKLNGSMCLRHGEVASIEIEHAEPLGSLGLNGACDDPAVYVPTGGEDL
ncbi:hypothetical protein F511_21300 [Dorcoceras hygrometricum]|uniref:Uncharacterized protein n=1 Tax=Dorcoceras hygrometricum TaxID=472368 RepID=A0A2Z7BLS2_9LAMI|nr:hypothetical protein F511_21300 [Dorcoceras hygrometricum]